MNDTNVIYTVCIYITIFTFPQYTEYSEKIIILNVHNIILNLLTEKEWVVGTSSTYGEEKVVTFWSKVNEKSYLVDERVEVWEWAEILGIVFRNKDFIMAF